MDRLTFRYEYDPEEKIENWLERLLTESQSGHWQSLNSAYPNVNAAVAAPLMIRLVVFIGLLANDQDFITPVVLNKDRVRYESADDPDVRKWLEDRAVRKMGRGFDVFKKLELERETSPHWRNPHLALFWTGPGRTKPVIRMRSGSVVQRVSMAEVPTGYLGPETADEDRYFDFQRQRINVPKGLRFEVFRRDNYRCRICGRSAVEDGVKLHVDHIVADSKGGSIALENLQTLCQDCNLGKSNKDL